MAASLMDPWSRPENIVGATKKEEMATNAKIAKDTNKNSLEISKDILFRKICLKKNPKRIRKNPSGIQAEKNPPKVMAKAIHPKNIQKEEKTAKRVYSFFSALKKPLPVILLSDLIEFNISFNIKSSFNNQFGKQSELS